MERREEAIKKFGFICPSSLTESIKMLGYNLGENYDSQELIAFSHWSRSLIANDYNLNHPDFKEYNKYHLKEDVSWLKKGYTYVDIKEYIKFKNNGG